LSVQSNSVRDRQTWVYRILNYINIFFIYLPTT
jgi:hypothetical protein